MCPNIHRGRENTFLKLLVGYDLFNQIFDTFNANIFKRLSPKEIDQSLPMFVLMQRKQLYDRDKCKLWTQV